MGKKKPKQISVQKFRLPKTPGARALSQVFLFSFSHCLYLASLAFSTWIVIVMCPKVVLLFLTTESLCLFFGPRHCTTSVNYYYRSNTKSMQDERNTKVQRKRKPGRRLSSLESRAPISHLDGYEQRTRIPVKPKQTQDFSTHMH